MNHICQGVEVSLISGYDTFPVPLINIGAVIVVQEIVLSYGTHVRADAFAFLTQELLEGKAFPFGGCLNNLGFNAFIKTQTAWKVDWRTGSIAVQVVVHPAVLIHNQRDLNHLQIEVLAQVLFNKVFDLINGLHSVFGIQDGLIVGWENLLYFFVSADARSGQVCFFVCHDCLLSGVC